MAPAVGTMIFSFVSGVPIAGPTLGFPQLVPFPIETVGIFLTCPFVIAVSGNAHFDDLDGLAAFAKENKLVVGYFGAPLDPTRATLAVTKEKGLQLGGDVAFDAINCNTLASGDADVINTAL